MKRLKFKPKAIIFDMDGVITDTMSYHFRAWKKAFKAFGIKASYCDIYLREGQRGLQTAVDLMKENGFKTSKSKAEEILQLKEEIFKKITKYKLIKGAKKLIKDLKKNKFKLALVTGTGRSELKYILPLEILNLFDFTITGSEVKRGKPNPEPYLKALKGLNLRPKDCLVLENAPFGIESAKKADIYCLAVTTYLPAKYLKEADMILNSLEEIDKVIFNGR